MRNICLLLLLSGLAFGQGAVFNDIALSPTGKPIASATVRVCTAAATGTPCTPLANVYSDAALTIPSNPLTSSAVGNFNFYGAAEKYQIQVTSAGSTYTYFAVPGNANQGIRYADQFTGVSVGLQMDAACTDLGGANGTIVIPASMGAGWSVAGLASNCHPIDLRDKEASIIGCTNVKSVGALADNSTDNTAKFNAAAAAALADKNCVFVPNGSYVVEGQVNIQAGQAWIFDNATIRHTTPGQTMFSAVSINDWSFNGPVILQGVNSGTVAGIATSEAMLYVAGGHRWKINNVYAKFSNGWGYKHDPGSFSSPRGDQGHVSDSDFSTNYYGIEVAPGNGAEYTIMTNVSGSANTFGLVIEAGNTQCGNCNFTDNGTNLALLSGTNHGHGEITGGNFNHATVDNLLCMNVTNGMTISGAHFYANDTISGFIHLNGCNGIHITDGFIDSVIKNENANGSNNFIVNNYMVTATGQTTPTGGSGETNLSIVLNYTPSGFWARNNGLAAGNGLTATSTLTIGAGTTIKKYIEGTVTVDLANILANTCVDTAGITVTGALDGDVAVGSALAAIASTAGLQISAYVSASDTAKVRVCNVTVGAIDPASTTYRVGVWVH